MGADEKARTMAYLVDRWIGNSFSKSLLDFLTKRDSRGRRIDRIFMDYSRRRKMGMSKITATIMAQFI